MSQPSTPGSPLGQKEEELLQKYFQLISQFAFDKAKELMVNTIIVHTHKFQPYI